MSVRSPRVDSPGTIRPPTAKLEGAALARVFSITTKGRVAVQKFEWTSLPFTMVLKAREFARRFPSLN